MAHRGISSASETFHLGFMGIARVVLHQEDVGAAAKFVAATFDQETWTSEIGAPLTV